MQVQAGNRKFYAFLITIIAFVVIVIALIIMLFLMQKLDSSFFNLFVPLGTGLMLIAGPFYAGNVFANRNKNEQA